MAFSFKAIAQDSVSDSRGDVQESWNYNGGNALANDSLATIKASAYFNLFAGSLAIGDKIYILDNVDATDLVQITAVTPNVTTTSILNALPPGSITLSELAVGISPSHVVKFAQCEPTVGGSATESFPIPGILTSDIPFAIIVQNGAAPVFVHRATIGAPGILSIQFSGNPSNDHIVAYQILRLAVE